VIITRATEYSIRAMLHLAEKYPTPVISKREICEAEKITPAFLTKILQPLIKSGLVLSKRGVSGGFALAREPSRITILDVMRAVDESLVLNVCMAQEDECERSSFCPIHVIWNQVKISMEEAFSEKSLAELVEEKNAKLAFVKSS